MFEDFRNQIDDSSLHKNDQAEKPLVESYHEDSQFLGMTPVQRFIVAFLLLMMVIILGTLFLLVTSKIVPPFLG